MASNVSNKKVNIYIDQASAEAALESLQKKADGLNTKIQNARNSQQALNQKITEAATAGKDTTKLQQQYDTLTQRIKDYQKSLSGILPQQTAIQQQINSGLSPSFAQLESFVNKLRNQLKNLSQDAPEYAAKFEQFRKSSQQLNLLRDAMNGVERAQKSWFDEAKGIAFGVLIGNTIQQAITAVVQYVNGIVSSKAKLSDSLADLRRVAGLTAQEASNLNKKLGEIDTRTSVSALRDIAIVAGKLGVAKEDIFGFTKSVDQLVVALGDELGNADQITTTLGKILNVFDGKVDGDNILKLGNAFVKLANDGVASGGYIAEFAQRISGIAKASNLSLGATVGLGAGLEELGGKVESSSTAVQKLITTIGADIPKAAKIAGAKTKQDIQDFANLFASAPEEALLQFAQGLTKNKAAFSEISASFKDAGEEGARTISTLIQLGQKTDYFRGKINEGKQAIQGTGEVTDAFKLKNETLGAELDKLTKKFDAFKQSESFNDFIIAAVRAFSGLLDVLKALPKILSDNKTAIGLLVTGILLLNASTIKAGLSIANKTLLTLVDTAAEKLNLFWTDLSTRAKLAYSIIVDLVTGKIKLATAAQQIWGYVMNASLGPIGLLAIALGALTFAFTAGTASIDEQKKALSAYDEIQSEVGKKMTETASVTISHIDELISIIKDETSSLGLRKQAYDTLVAIAPEFTGTLDKEYKATDKLNGVYETYIKNLRAAAEAKALGSIREKYAQEKAQKEADAFEAKIKADQEKKDNAATAAKNKKQAKEDVTGGDTQFSGDVNAVDPLSTSAQKDYEQKIKEADLAAKKIEAYDQFVNVSVQKRQENIDKLKEKLKKLKKDTEDYNKLNAQILNEQGQIDVILGKPSSKDGQQGDTPVTTPHDKKYDEMLAAAKEFDKKIRDLKNGSAVAAQSTDDKEITDAKHKYDEIFIAYKEVQEKIKDSDIKLAFSQADIKKLEGEEIIALIQKQAKKLAEETLKAAEEADNREYQQRLASSASFYEQLKLNEAQRFVKREIDEKGYQANVTQIDADAKNDQLNISLLYAGRVKKAAEDVTKKQRDELDAQVKATIDAYKKKQDELKQAQELDYQTRLKHAETQLALDRDQASKTLADKKAIEAIQYQNQLQNLNNERTQRLSAVTGTDEEIAQKKKAINDAVNQQIQDAEAAHLQKLKDLNDAYFQQQAQNVIGYFQSVLNVAEKFAQAQTNRENAELARDQKANDKKKAALQQQLNGKLLTQQEYQRQVNAIDADADKKKAALEKKQFERNQKIQIAQTLANAAAAAIQLWFKPGFPENIPLFAILAAQTIAEIAVISSQKPAFAKGGKVQPLEDGKIVTPSNIPVQPNGDDILATVKRGEVILNEQQQQALGGDAIFRAINVPGFAGGGYAGPRYITEPYQPVSYAAITRSLQISRGFANGGLVNNSSATEGTAGAAPAVVVQSDEEMKALMRMVIHHLQNPVNSQVIFSLTNLQLAQDQKTRIINDAALR